MKKVYFPNLNGLRFIAASLVIIHHIEQLKSIFGMPNYLENPFIMSAGPFGVGLFFVLSGFLITYLLIEERRATATISIKDFYMRRVLRIWPLYYLIVLLALFVLPQIDSLAIPKWSEALDDHFARKVFYFIFFLPNLALVQFMPLPYASQTWSIGVEEQFYLIQPWLVKKFKNLLAVLLAVGMTYFIVKVTLDYSKIYEANRHLRTFFAFWQTLNFDCFAIGGIAAVALQRKAKILNIIFNKYFQIITLLATIALILGGVVVPYIQQEFYALLFAVIILNMAANKETIINLENRVFSHLGNISYGLYMYHLLAIGITIKSLEWLNLGSNILIYIFSFALTILLSSVSYYYFERIFINLKRGFSKIITNNSPRGEV